MHLPRGRLLVFLLLGTIKVCAGDEPSKFFQFRKTTLDNFNEARRLLASGDFRKLYDLVGHLIGKDRFNPEILGPASNMYQLKWNRQLEQIGFEYMTNTSIARSKSLVKSIEYKDHIGFYWMGNLFNILNDLFGGAVPIAEFKKALEKFLDILEAIIIFIWLAFTSPKTRQLQKGKLYGPAEALFAERYEIGCFTEIAYSVCFMKRLPFRDNMFEKGVACTSCPTHCEYSKLPDGTFDEGELCVAPKEPQLNYVAANMTLTGFSHSEYSAITIFVQAVILFVPNINY